MFRWLVIYYPYTIDNLRSTLGLPKQLTNRKRGGEEGNTQASTMSQVERGRIHADVQLISEDPASKSSEGRDRGGTGQLPGSVANRGKGGG